MKRNWPIIFLGAVLVVALHAALFSSPIGQRAELMLSDVWFNLRGPIDPPPNVVFLALDEISYNDLNVPLNQAWPRRLHAELLERLAELGAKGVVFDILFADPGADEEADQLFQNALTKLPVVLGAEAMFRSVRAVSGSYMLEEMQLPHQPFEEKANNVALVGLPEDIGVVRRFLTTRTEQTRDYPTLSEAGAMLLAPLTKRPGAKDLLNHYGPSRTIPTYSVYQALQTERPLPAAVFKDKVVFVGVAMRTAVGPAQKDVFGSPFYGELVSGTEIHATATANLIADDWIRRASFAVEILALSVVAFTASVAVLALSPVVSLVTVLGFLVVWALGGYLLFLGGFFVPGLFLFVGVLPLLLLVSTLLYYLKARKQASKIRSAFELYLSPAMAEQMSRSADALKLGGEKIYATALFTDIVGFSSISEDLPAERVSAMLNAYFTEVMDAVLENQGTLIKFIGDAVFVLWGAPIKIDNHAELAIRTALVIQRKVEAFNATGKFPPLLTRIGVNTGPMVVGNLGSAKRFDFTAVGDAVNLASRVEGANKYLGTSILLSESSRKEAGSLTGFVPVAAAHVTGKKEAAALFTVFEPALAADAQAQWEQALGYFREQRWDEALAAMRGLKGLTSAQNVVFGALTRFYEEQISMFRVNPPPPGWRGEVVFSGK